MKEVAEMASKVRRGFTHIQAHDRRVAISSAGPPKALYQRCNAPGRIYLSYSAHPTDINSHLQSAGTNGRSRSRGFKLCLCLFAQFLGDGTMMNNKWVRSELVPFHQFVEFDSQLLDRALGVYEDQIRGAREITDDILGDLVKFIIFRPIGIL